MKIKFLIITSLLIFAYGFIKFSGKRDYSRFDIKTLKTGDLIFVRGISIKSYVVLLFQKQTSNYSHCGVIEEDNGKFFVVHATPTPVDQKRPRIVKESLNDFFNFNKVTIAAVFRVDDSIEHKNFLNYINNQLKLEIDFDDEFSLSNKKLYCTELIWRAFLADHIAIVDTSKINKIIFPADLIANKRLFAIYTFKAY